MTHEEFMALRPGDLVIVSGQYFGQVTAIEDIEAGKKYDSGYGDSFVYDRNIHGVTIEYNGYNNVPVVFSPYVYTDYGVREIHNRIMLARLELWKGE